VAELFLLPKSDDAGVPDASFPPDWAAREQALEVGRSWIVEAPAGSGKTGLLIQRLLKLLAQESVSEPKQVLAITFTKKATEEIRQRVVEQLEAASTAAPLKRDGAFERVTRELAEAVLRRDAALGWGLLDDPRRLRVQTIDSVCAEIARSLPVLSGSGGGLKPVEDASSLHQEAAQRTLLQLGGSNAVLHEALTKLLLHRDGGLGDCMRLIAEMLARREQWSEFVPLTGEELTEAYLDGEVLPKLERALEVAICAGLTRFANSLPDPLLHQMAILAGEFADLPPYKPEIHPFEICRSMQGAPQEIVEHLEHWRAMAHLLVKKDGDWRGRFYKNDLGVELERHHSAALGVLVEELREREDVLRAAQMLRSLPPAKYPKEQWEEAKALFRVLRQALAELQVVFAERSECDFAELTLLAKFALREAGTEEMTAALGMRLEHLLVDEVQDTSTSHYDLIEMLTEGWDGAGQTVFLVGDPKQSIYMFRQARVELFLRTMKSGQLGELPLGRLQLTANFRSQRDLVETFNDDFELLFPRHARDANEVAFVQAEAVRETTQLGDGVKAVRWHTCALPAGLTSEEKQKAKRLQRREDAAMVRAVVERWRATPLPKGRTEPWKLAVLVRNRGHLKEIVRELTGDAMRAAIPFRAVDIVELGERQEVLDLFALTRALLHPADRVAWLAVLRAPWCGMGLADLHVLAGSDDPAWKHRSLWDVMAERGELLSGDGIARLERLWLVMQAAEMQRGRLTAAQWVERTWRSLGGDRYLTAEGSGNARRYLQLLDEMEEEAGQVGVVDPTRLKERLTKLYAESPARADAVELVTIHKAKGLEWDVVMVPGLERTTQADGGRLLTWEEMDTVDESAAHVVLAPIEGRGKEAQALNKWLNGMRKAREAAERTRLFYVACTRAREELHLFAAPEMNRSGEISRRTGCLLEAAWPAAEQHFAKSAATTTDSMVQLVPAGPFDTDEEGLSSAAGGGIAADSEPPPVMLQRLPLSFDPAARFAGASRLAYGAVDESADRAHFARPEGSFAARAFGNAVHGFLELASQRLAAGIPAEALAREIATWATRIEAVLRSEGLPPATVRREAQRVLSAVESGLEDAAGRWVLGARDEAASEYAFTTWQERRKSFRLDRLFVAGAEPLAAGDDCLWIVDYKTTAHGRGIGVEEFLAEERKKYAPQMESYARAMGDVAEGKELRVGLYYPLLPKLLWWKPE
jgi:ATP-dependent helicase/nuclease subunit A